MQQAAILFHALFLDVCFNRRPFYFLLVVKIFLRVLFNRLRM